MIMILRRAIISTDHLIQTMSKVKYEKWKTRSFIRIVSHWSVITVTVNGQSLTHRACWSCHNVVLLSHWSLISLCKLLLDHLLAMIARDGLVLLWILWDENYDDNAFRHVRWGEQLDWWWWWWWLISWPVRQQVAFQVDDKPLLHRCIDACDL